jgi:hypothetical protein
MIASYRANHRPLIIICPEGLISINLAQLTLQSMKNNKGAARFILATPLFASR